MSSAFQQRWLSPARPAPAGIVARTAAWVAVATAIVYAGQKVYMAAIGKIGMPGHLAPESVQAQFQHPGLAQAGNAAIGLLAGALALATITRWGARIPRWMLRTALLVTLTMLTMGAAITVYRAELLFEVVLALTQTAAWFVAVGSYHLRSRTLVLQ